MTYQFLTRTQTIGSLHGQQTLTSLLFNFTVNSYSYLLTMERGIIFDGQPSLTGNVRPGFYIEYPASDFYLGTAFVQGFCPSSRLTWGKWRTIEYDPTIVALFETSFSTPTSPSYVAKQKKTWATGLAIAIPLTVVLLVIIVLLVMFVPPVRHFFQPFTKRNAANTTSHTHSNSNTLLSPNSKEGGWTKASKPQ